MFENSGCLQMHDEGGWTPMLKSTGMSLTKLMFFLCLDTARFYAVRNEHSTLWYIVLKMA